MEEFILEFVLAKLKCVLGIATGDSSVSCVIFPNESGSETVLLSFVEKNPPKGEIFIDSLELTILLFFSGVSHRKLFGISIDNLAFSTDELCKLQEDVNKMYNM